jgi:capsular exopolysaccharide synthesis family protein
MAEQTTIDPAPAPSLLGLLRRRWYAILIPLLLGAGSALAFSLLQEKEYEASTSILFQDSGSSVLASQDPQREAATNVRLLQLDVLEQRVDASLKKPFTGSVDVVAEADSNLATITVTDTDPEQAARAANAFAAEYIDLREQAAQDEIELQRKRVNEKLAALPPGQRRFSAEGTALKQRLEELALASTTPSPVRQISRARPPAAAASPDTVQNTVIGGLIGLALGILLAIGLERRDRRVRDPHQIEEALARPIIGTIPRSRTLAKAGPGTAALPPPEAEAFRTVRANLRHQLRARNASSVLVTSANPGEGKTTVAWNLARMEAAAGTRVLLVEADMRRPVLAAKLGANGAPGLSELLAGKEPLQSVVWSVEFADHVNGGSARGTADVLFAGTPTANPSELLGSERMQAVLDVVASSYDLVLLDTPPTSVVSDAIPILDLVGGVVVVGRIGLTTHDSIAELRDQLETFDSPTVGVVVNANPKSTESYGYYRAAGRDS